MFNYLCSTECIDVRSEFDSLTNLLLVTIAVFALVQIYRYMTMWAGDRIFPTWLNVIVSVAGLYVMGGSMLFIWAGQQHGVDGGMLWGAFVMGVLMILIGEADFGAGHPVIRLMVASGRLVVQTEQSLIVRIFAWLLRFLTWTVLALSSPFLLYVLMVALEPIFGDGNGLQTEMDPLGILVIMVIVTIFTWVGWYQLTEHHESPNRPTWASWLLALCLWPATLMYNIMRALIVAMRSHATCVA